MATVEQLYKDFSVLADAKEKAGEHEEHFVSILSAVKGNSSEKRLASQFLARFFKYFPGLASRVIEAQLDLCEDEDSSIRRQAIKDLPLFCKGSPERVPRIADVLTQLLQTEDDGELSVVQGALLNLFNYEMKGALEGLFTQILEGEEIVRERAIRFLSSKLKSIPEEIITPEVEWNIVEGSKKVLQDVTGEEFLAFMGILSHLESMQTLKGRQTLVELVTQQADLSQPFEPSDPDCVDRLVQCIGQALPFFSRNVHATPFLVYMCDHVLPVLADVKTHDMIGEGATSQPSTDIQLELLKLFADMSAFTGHKLGEKHNQRLEKLYNKLIEYMPLPQDKEEHDDPSTPGTPKLQFSYVECLIFAFHQLCAKTPKFLTSPQNLDRLKDFRLRLQIFGLEVQVYVKQLKLSLQGKTAHDLKTEENKMKLTALKVTNNISLLIKDLFHNPPSFKTLINLSWKPVSEKPVKTSPGLKRANKPPVSYDGQSSTKKEKKQQGPRKLYAPPTGRWSDGAGSYQNSNGGGHGQRGGLRGRGRGAIGRVYRR